VFKGGFSDNISGNDSAYIKGKLDKKDKIEPVKPFDDDENSVYTSALVNDFLEKIYEVLKNHPVNLQRIKRGLMPANFILIRGSGIEPPKLQKYNNWISLGYMPLEIGFSRSCGMRVYSFNYPKLKSLDSYENLHAGLRKACKYAIKMVKKNSKAYDYAYIHIKETDTPGHDNKPFEKKEMIEYIDKTLFRFLRSFLPSRGIKLVVTGDHSTPCSLKNHSAGPVPLLFYDQSFLKEKHFNEKEARRGELKGILGKDLFKIVGFKK